MFYFAWRVYSTDKLPDKPSFETWYVKHMGLPCSAFSHLTKLIIVHQQSKTARVIVETSIGNKKLE